MYRRLLTHAAPWIAGVACAVAPVVAGAQSRSVEFAELVKVLLAPVSEQSGLPHWLLVEHAAIRWKSAAPRPSDPPLDGNGLLLSRNGAVRITVGGQITHLNGQRPGQWLVTIAGTTSHPMEAHLSMDKPGNVTFDPAEVLRAAGFKVEPLCKPGGVGSGKSVFSLEVPGQRPVGLSHEWSSGSGGTWMAVKIAYTPKRAALMHCE